MTKDGVIKLLDKKLEKIERDDILFPGNSSYFAGMKEAILYAKGIAGMLNMKNNK